MVLKIRPAGNQTLRELLFRKGVCLPGACGGRGRCQRCEVKVNGKPLLACQYVPQIPVVVEINEPLPSSPPQFKIHTSKFKPQNLNLTVAVDIGTTTITLAAVHPPSKRPVQTTTILNPQAQFGADVITRIANLKQVKKIRLTAIIRQFIKETGIDHRRRVTVVGNTVMMHFLFGKNPAPLGFYPYRPVLPLRQVVKARIDGLHILTLPLAGSFIGSDCTAAIIASGIYKSEQPVLLIDAGTNGELVLGNKYRLLACSTAAGPAFEGATLNCGSLYQPGAVVAADYQSGVWKLKTVHNLPPRSLCGSGVLDVVAAGIRSGLISPSGRLVHNRQLIVYEQADRTVYLSQSDLREIQLAKAAITTGIRMLLKKWFGTDRRPDGQISRVVLTGRFGNRINPASAFTIGLFPRFTKTPIRQHPNLALAGAIQASITPALWATAEKFAWQIEELRLAEQPEFESIFVQEMELKEWE